MPKEIIFKPNTPVSELLKTYKQRQIILCIPPEKLTDALSNPWRVRYADKTLSEMADGLQDEDFQPWLGVWFLQYFGEETDVNLRMKIIAAIKDPMMACQVYITFAWLTDEEDKLLESIFKGKLPTPERQLADGSLTRAKRT